MGSYKTIKKYLDDLASRTPVPGGGSASAFSGAMGCALLEMVVNYSDKNKQLIRKSAAILKNYRKLFLRLLEEDIDAYKNLCAVRQKHSGRITNSHAIQKALEKATLVPLEICVSSREIMKLCKKLQEKVNKNLMSDMGCAKSALICAFNSAKFNVDINLKYVRNKKFVNFVRKKLKK